MAREDIDNLPLGDSLRACNLITSGLQQTGSSPGSHLVQVAEEKI
jgi:hypothetical protein